MSPDRLQNQGSRPVPDPTVLTTELVDRAVLVLNERLAMQFEAVSNRMNAIEANTGEKVSSIQHILETRLAGMDKAIELKLALDAALRSVHEEKFRSIATQFVERDVRAEQTARDSKVAVDAALQAAKEAVGEQNKSSALAIAKSEAATTKQIEQLGTQMQATNKGTDDKIDNIKERLTRIEGSGIGAGAERRQQQTNTSQIMAIIFGLVGAAGVATAVIVAIIR